MRLRDHGIKIKNLNGFEYNLAGCESFQVYQNGVKITPGSTVAEDGFETYSKARRFAEKYMAERFEKELAAMDRSVGNLRGIEYPPTPSTKPGDK